MQPLVSVVIPSIPSRMEYLQRAVQSVKNQTYKNIEIITIMDDTINSNQARNKGVKLAKGDFIAFLDDDDIWHPEKIERQMQVMLRHPNIALVTCYSRDFRYGEYVDKPPKRVTQEDVLNSFSYSSTSTYLVRRYALDVAGGFDESLPSAQEYDLAIRLLEYHDALCVPEVLVVQNASTGQISTDIKKKIKGLVMVYRKHRRMFREASILNGLKFCSLCLLYCFALIFGVKLILFAKKIGDMIRFVW